MYRACVSRNLHDAGAPDHRVAASRSVRKSRRRPIGKDLSPDGRNTLPPQPPTLAPGTHRPGHGSEQNQRKAKQDHASAMGDQRAGQEHRWTGEHSDLELAVRAHGNFSEYVPMALLLLLLEASTAVAPLMLHVLGVVLLAGRLLHGYFGLNRSASKSVGRFYGTLLTCLMLLAAALLCVWVAVGRWIFLAG